MKIPTFVSGWENLLANVETKARQSLGRSIAKRMPGKRRKTH
jgi:hypothetical protein